MTERLNWIFLVCNMIILTAALLMWIKKRSGGVESLCDSGEASGLCTWKELIVFTTVCLLALSIRLWRFGSIPAGMNQDGAMAAVDAKALAEHGTDRYGMLFPVHFTAWGFGQMSVLLSYCMVPLIKLFGMNSITARLPILIASMAGVIAIYFVVRRLLGVRAAQIALLLTAFNPWHFLQSRWALDCNMLPHMFILGLLFLLEGLNRRRWYVYLSMVFFALCMYSYGIAFYTVPVFLAAMAIYILKQRVMNCRDILLCAGVYLLLSCPIYLTMLINTLGISTIETPFFTIPFFPNSVRSRDILFFSDAPQKQLLSNFQSLMHTIAYGDNAPWNTIPGFGAINLCFVPFILLGLCFIIDLLRKERSAVRKIGLFSLISFFGVGVLAGLITKNVNVNRANMILYPNIILAAVGIYFVYLNSRMLFSAIVQTFVILSALLVITYFTDYAEEVAPYFYSEFLEAVEYVGQAPRCDRYVITPDTKYPGAKNVSEILTLYAHQVDAEYYQGMYPDENGRTYFEKYTYANASVVGVAEDNDVGYVITANERELFDTDNYEIIPFGNYCAVVPESPTESFRKK